VHAYNPTGREKEVQKHNFTLRVHYNALVALSVERETGQEW